MKGIGDICVKELRFCFRDIWESLVSFKGSCSSEEEGRSAHVYAGPLGVSVEFVTFADYFKHLIHIHLIFFRALCQ